MNAVFTIPQMIALEKRAFAEGVDAWSLMQQAGTKMAEAIVQRFPEPGFCWVFAGKGNNGGDAWVVARCLQDLDWEVEIFTDMDSRETSTLNQRARADWEKNQRIYDYRIPFSARRKTFLIVDGLLGIGSRGEPRHPVLGLIRKINGLRKNGATVFSLDVPSGLGSATSVVADVTLTVGMAKDVLLEDAATAFVGRLEVLPLEELSSRVVERSEDAEVATAEDLRSLLPPRSFDAHKGQFGRVTIVAGSLGTAGAAVLAANGALRAGAGLVSLVCPPEIYAALAPMLPPEIMARPWDKLEDIAQEKMDILAIGSGLDPKWRKEIWALLEAASVPLVLDAGALTILAEDISRLEKITVVPVLLTPHPGEMERLFPAQNRTRAQWATDFVSRYGNDQLTLLLKGARTIVAQRGQPHSYNTTGHPGMATGGMGDTLTGVCAALIAQGLSTRDAARLGAWVCGRAAEIAIESGAQSQESLLPSDVAVNLGRAFTDLRAGVH